MPQQHPLLEFATNRYKITLYLLIQKKGHLPIHLIIVDCEEGACDYNFLLRSRFMHDPCHLHIIIYQYEARMRVLSCLANVSSYLSAIRIGWSVATSIMCAMLLASDIGMRNVRRPFQFLAMLCVYHFSPGGA